MLALPRRGKLSLDVRPGDDEEIIVCRARKAVQRCATEWGVPDHAFEFGLMTTELVTNARTALLELMAARGYDPEVHIPVIWLYVMRMRGSLVIAVEDSVPAEPQPRKVVDDEDEHGRGYMLIEELAKNWGVMLLPSVKGRPGKIVWAQYALLPQRRNVRAESAVQPNWVPDVEALEKAIRGLSCGPQKPTEVPVLAAAA